MPNDDPAALGTAEAGMGFPACTATVEYPGRGYRALFGWVQLVRSTDNASGGRDFEADPFSLFEDVSSLYCWFGTTPTLFDAPSRDEKLPMEWLAHSFLAMSPLRERRRRVVPLLGFSWGFDIDDRARITLKSVTRLSGEEWDAHAAYLGRSYPEWSFSQAPQ